MSTQISEIGIKLTKESPNISYLMFVYDCLILQSQKKGDKNG